ncbi:MAG TPA: SIMPL domain-containing protein [Candidatus Sulfotelmatobacter sp.]|nr:SIMPL domain-containing protein [Candidatus Sulfotelmatobacter sp.]
MKALVFAALAAVVPAAAVAQARLPISQHPPAGITVTGHGTVTVRVQQLWFVALVRGTADEQSIRAALEAAGIDNVSIGSEGSAVFPNAPTAVRGMIHDVSPLRLDQVRAAAADFVRTHPGTTIDNIRFTPPLVGCATNFEQPARENAMADARRKAEALAAASQVSLGAIVAVDESGGCPTIDPGSVMSAGQTNFNLTTLTAAVNVTETVTYAIR